MPRPRIDLGARQDGTLSAGRRSRPAPSPTGKLLDAARSPRYLAAIGRLDASGRLSPVEITEIVDTVRREFEDRWSAVPLGIVSHCYLGSPFEAHTLTVDGSIIEHYRAGEALPGPLERARGLTRSTTYLAIEVYGDRLVCVHPDGSVTVLGAEA